LDRVEGANHIQLQALTVFVLIIAGDKPGYLEYAGVMYEDVNFSPANLSGGTGEGSIDSGALAQIDSFKDHLSCPIRVGFGDFFGSGLQPVNTAAEYCDDSGTGLCEGNCHGLADASTTTRDKNDPFRDL
jgi:hypothetical protein